VHPKPSEMGLQMGLGLGGDSAAYLCGGAAEGRPTVGEPRWAGPPPLLQSTGH
jgi:hypothetical protein